VVLELSRTHQYSIQPLSLEELEELELELELVVVPPEVVVVVVVVPELKSYPLWLLPLTVYEM
jgi:hypothetical protein